MVCAWRQQCLAAYGATLNTTIRQRCNNTAYSLCLIFAAILDLGEG